MGAESLTSTFEEGLDTGQEIGVFHDVVMGGELDEGGDDSLLEEFL